ncbi:hypothetical protein DPMN_159180 [Dreissena polymorpha]|uniref:Uncharacterized protein n=1 Tax=Dreissena polymorpha TaxID=45954 RepID=A0A9D4IRJ8_DREPO|nr:hypothetical protein DPMN_159180 [Dreissena polymorpha]
MQNRYFSPRMVFMTMTCALFVTLIATVNANWYGKRGDKLDSGLFEILQGSLPDMLDKQLDAQLTLQTIAKILQDYEIRQLDVVSEQSHKK